MQNNTKIIQSLLDNDLYKFTMQQGVLALFPNRVAKYRFTNRGAEKFTPTMLARLNETLGAMKDLKLTQEEEAYLRQQGLFSEEYLAYLRDFRFNPSEVTARINDEGRLDMTIEGNWAQTILWEVPLMAAISQITLDENAPLTVAERAAFIKKSVIKAALVRDNELNLSEFGTRRRRDFWSHETIVKELAANAGPTFAGTSNVHLARLYNLKPIGTMAHEWVMGHAAVFGVKNANRKALESWKKIYPNKLKIFLPDTFTSDMAFEQLTDNDMRYLDGVRWDSGAAMEFKDKFVARLERAGIDPTTKTIPFTDGLNYEGAVEIKNKVMGQIRPSFGIGTASTNDYAAPALKIVIKLEALDGIEVAKISDTPGKASGRRAVVENTLREIEEVLTVNTTLSTR